jgi:hypothetical protein
VKRTSGRERFGFYEPKRPAAGAEAGRKERRRIMVVYPECNGEKLGFAISVDARPVREFVISAKAQAR